MLFSGHFKYALSLSNDKSDDKSAAISRARPRPLRGAYLIRPALLVVADLPPRAGGEQIEMAVGNVMTGQALPSSK